ncbi:MAG: Rpn family recombination-promoting nuclease/putative transposase [Ruminococcus flavefaciens]|nr:Rpn family recombination-promoting nuclease/putative transposase [Ruminococcus flavefaciens]
MPKSEPKGRPAGEPNAARRSKAKTEIRQKNQVTPKPAARAENGVEILAAVQAANDPKTPTPVRNTKLQDSGCKVIFEDNTLCAQFLRDYIDLPCMKDIQPGDIEDVSAQFVPLIAQERDADRVKRVHIRGKEPFFLISLVEHKTKVDYNVSMQIFRYMFLIWDAYEKEAEKLQKGISRRKEFRYPPILPILYYEGSAEWNVPRDFISRVTNGQAFQEYLPNFRYYLVPLKDYTNQELMARKDEISLVMMINKMQTKEDIEAFRLLPAGEIDAIVKDSPEHLVRIIADILLAFLLKTNVPAAEAENLRDKVREKKVAELFADMEKLDIQAERRNTEEQRMRAEAAERNLEAANRSLEAKAQTAERAIALLVESFQESGMTRETACKKLTEKAGLSEEETNAAIRRYWPS